jgi:hypothetical protein
MMTALQLQETFMETDMLLSRNWYLGMNLKSNKMGTAHASCNSNFII